MDDEDLLQQLRQPNTTQRGTFASTSASGVRQRTKRPDTDDVSVKTSQQGEVGDPLGLSADLPELDNDPRSRLSRVLCCHLFVTVIMTACMCTLTVYLSQDSQTLDHLAKRTETYMDTIEQSQILELPKAVHDSYVQTWGPAINVTMHTAVQTAEVLLALREQFIRDEVLKSIHEALLEGRDLLRIINDTIHKGTLGFNLQI